MSEWIPIIAIIIAALVVIGVILTLVVFKRKKEGKMGELNYRVFFNIGMVWIPVGIVFMIAINPAIGIAFMALGITYFAIGLANSDKWKKRLGPDVNEYIFKQKESRKKIDGKQETECFNDLYYASRGHYEIIIAGEDNLGKQNWKLIFEPCFKSEGLNGIKEILSLYKLIADPDKHNMQELWFSRNSDKVLILLQRTKKLIELINHSIYS